MRTAAWLVTPIRVLATLLVAVPAWVVLGFLATAPLGAVYGWSGHPSIPGAPTWVYVGVYLVVLPLVCAWPVWWLTGRVARARLRREGTR
jgi:hypothetical protein